MAAKAALGGKGHLSRWVRLPNRQSDGLTGCVCVCERAAAERAAAWGGGGGGYLFFSHYPLLTQVMENFKRGKSLKYPLNAGNGSSWRAEPALTISQSVFLADWCSRIGLLCSVL